MKPVVDKSNEKYLNIFNSNTTKQSKHKKKKMCVN